MHAWLAFLAGILFAVGLFLIVSAGLGVVYYGLAAPVEATIAVVLLVFGGIFAWLFIIGVRAQHKTVKTGKEALIGAYGVATTDLKPKGEVRVKGEFWQAKAKDGEIPSGSPVEVLCLEGMFLVVKPANVEKLNSAECQ